MTVNFKTHNKISQVYFKEYAYFIDYEAK